MISDDGSPRGGAEDDVDADEEIVDAEIVETPDPASAPSTIGQAPAGEQSSQQTPGVAADQSADPTTGVAGDQSAQPSRAAAESASDASSPSVAVSDDPAFFAPVPTAPVDPVTDYTDKGIPTFSYLQEKIERRYATALGAHELADATIPEATDATKRQERLAQSARERLDEIRRSLHPDAPDAPGASEGPSG